MMIARIIGIAIALAAFCVIGLVLVTALRMRNHMAGIGVRISWRLGKQPLQLLAIFAFGGALLVYWSFT